MIAFLHKNNVLWT